MKEAVAKAWHVGSSTGTLEGTELFQDVSTRV